MHSDAYGLPDCQIMTLAFERLLINVSRYSQPLCTQPRGAVATPQAPTKYPVLSYTKEWLHQYPAGASGQERLMAHISKLAIVIL